MQVKIVSFSVGVLAGLGAGVGYWRGYQQLNIIPTTDTAQSTLFKYGYPETPHSYHTYTSHSLLYDHCRKVPIWSAEAISQHCVSGTANRKKSKFQPDPSVPERFSSSNNDYHKSGWSRGHMTPAGDCKHDQNAMNDSHYLTNIVPQDFANNSGYWNRLEMYCRDLTKKYPTVYVISGPLYLPHEESGKRYVKYQVIGDNNVAVPTHLYKVILAEMEESVAGTAPSLTMGVFIVPNVALGNEDLSTFQTTLSDLERLSGITFHSKLDITQVGNLCETDTCKLMTEQQLKEFIYTKRLQSAKSGQQIDEILMDAEKDSGITTSMSQTATRRRNELTQSTQNKP